MTEPVNFEIAVLLKEKGFDKCTERFYPKPKCKLFGIDEHGRYYPIINNKCAYFLGKAAVLKEENALPAPTIAEVVMWLYEKHHVWIFVQIGNNYDYYIQSAQPPLGFIYSNGWFDSPKEAYEEAIEYTLKNLI